MALRTPPAPKSPLRAPRRTARVLDEPLGAGPVCPLKKRRLSMTSLRILRYTLLAATGAILASCATVKIQQRPTATAVSPSAYDRNQAEHAQRAMRRAMPANTPAARAARGTKRLATYPTGASPPPSGAVESSQSEQGIRYPGDVQFHGGKVVQSAEQYLI